MAAKQRDISVSEFFAKNRHLLGFDNPRKALLTTVKEAVDNSLDACEEAGILPEIWVHIEQTGPNRYKVGVQDNGPGILKKQIPLIFGKLLYGSKFHRLRMSRGQQGIGISAAGMYGVLTTGKPVKIISKIGARKPAHYYEIQIDTKNNKPEILNGKGEGVDLKSAGRYQEHGVEWVEANPAGPNRSITARASRSSWRPSTSAAAAASMSIWRRQRSPTRTSRCTTSTARATSTYERSATDLPPEPKEIKPHPYGIELGRLIDMLNQTKAPTVSQFLCTSFSRVSSGVARRVCETAGISTRANPHRTGRGDAEKLFKALQETRIQAPATDCLVPIGEPLILKGLHHVVPGEFYAAATRPPAVYRGNPFQIEVGSGVWRLPASRSALRATCWSSCSGTATSGRCGNS